MTFPTSVIALFCEDIREEKSGAITLLGIMPDNAIVPTLPPETPPNMVGGIPKLCIYIRVHFDPSVEPRDAKMTLLFPDGTVRDITSISQEMIDKARREAAEHGSPVCGIISRVVMQPFLVRNLGLLRVEVKIDGETYIAGAINFKTDSSPTVSPPPS